MPWRWCWEWSCCWPPACCGRGNNRRSDNRSPFRPEREEERYMENMPAWLIATLVAPLVGGALLSVLGRFGRDYARWIALVTTLVTLVLAGVVVYNFPADGQGAASYAVTDVPWLSPEMGLDIRFSVGLDGLGIYLFGLSALLMVTSVLVSWDAIQDRAALF